MNFFSVQIEALRQYLNPLCAWICFLNACSHLQCRFFCRKLRTVQQERGEPKGPLDGVVTGPSVKGFKLHSFFGHRACTTTDFRNLQGKCRCLCLSFAQEMLNFVSCMLTLHSNYITFPLWAILQTLPVMLFPPKSKFNSVKFFLSAFLHRRGSVRDRF